MKPRNFTSGLLIFVATMAVTYTGTSLGEQATPASQASFSPASTLTVARS